MLDILNLRSLEVLARERLDPMLFDYIAGGAADEWTLRENVEAFSRLQLLPRMLRGVATRSLDTSVLGTPVSMPILVPPMGFHGLCHDEAEEATARATGDERTIFCASTVSNRSLEAIAQASNGPRWFQLYVYRDREITRSLVERAAAAGYTALCLTVDTPLAGPRERDRRNNLRMPGHLELGNFVGAPEHGSSLRRSAPPLGMAEGESLRSAPPLGMGEGESLRSAPPLGMGEGESFEHGSSLRRSAPPLGMAEGESLRSAPPLGMGEGKSSLASYIASQWDPGLTWKDVEWLRSIAPMPVVVKGILAPDDAVLAVQHGAAAVIVSNHGGRQLDSVPAPITMLEQVVDAVDGRAEVLLDGGVRRGTDVLKSLALGARAVLVGRPVLWGLTLGGYDGVRSVLQHIRAETDLAMALAGCATVQDITKDLIA